MCGKQVDAKVRINGELLMVLSVKVLVRVRFIYKIQPTSSQNARFGFVLEWFLLSVFGKNC